MAEEKEYVQRLMAAKCTFGSMDFQYLNLPKDHGVYFQDTDHPMMNAVDHIADDHVLQFGRCTAPSNPKNIAGDVMSTVIPLFALAKLAKNAMGCSGCKCSPKTLKVWEDTNTGNCLDGADAILHSSTLQCFYGGEIEVTEIPESESNSEETTDEENPVEKKTLAERMPQAMAQKISSLNQSGGGTAPGGNQAKGGGASPGGSSAATPAGGGQATGMGVSSAGGQSGGTSTASGGGQPLRTAAAPMQALMADTTAWYAANAEDFEQNYSVSDDISLSNYANNMCQTIPVSSRNADGLICDMKGLTGFRMGGGSAAVLGAGCVACFNTLCLLGEKPSLGNIILAAEKQQTVKGYMDQGPMAVSMGSMRDYLSTLGYDTKVQSAEKLTSKKLTSKKLTSEELTSERFTAERLNTRKFVPQKQPEWKAAPDSISILGTSRNGQVAFHTLKTAPDRGVFSAEQPDLPLEKLLPAKEKQPALILQVSKRNK